MDPVADIGADIAGSYRAFARHCAAGGSPAYARICEELAQDEEVLGLVASLPEGAKRQPNLLLGAVRFLGGPVQTWQAWREWLVGHWGEVRSVVLERRTQTNEVRRCATLLPVLASIPGPLALLEVGASAGLCLYPDRYRYSFDGGAEVGPAQSPVLLECATSGGVPVPDRVPQVVWRAGIDVNPLDAGDEGDVRWLESLVWPGEAEAVRRERLRGAASVVAADPPLLVEGDLVERLGEVAAWAPEGATLVVFHSAVLAYLPRERREAFERAVGRVRGRWVSNEGWRVFPGWENAEPVVDTDFTLAVDGRVVAYTGGHGQSVAWV
ncbi:DUF2332 domain-containing protein [Nocardiopsis sp. CT-R113]|uniref:DUF2332 domain-containing protein n=1 Tax=Nocardiopsis codii TaxID=3065942 RepID=A0ABU7KG73_9ACTN|nr:DUF2332 domain-containing protein [Nocardiopsis sp. CT-R113]MEE2041245.1 DUF2332 domain-containing protein [Nocardiopsis sp. CT-R113]